MNKQEILSALKKARDSKKRNFKQKFDLIITLRNLDLKKPENHIELFIPLHYSKGKKVKTCALVGPELFASAKEGCDLAVSVDDFGKYSDKKALKRLANEYDFFIAQATIMPKVATTFGRVLGSKGKMPNPKAGCVVAPTANLRLLVQRLQKLIKVSVKTNSAMQTIVGNEEMPDEEIADNILTVYNALVHAMPAEKHNIKAAFVKLTMGEPIKIGAAEQPEKESEGVKKAIKVRKEVKGDIPKDTNKEMKIKKEIKKGNNERKTKEKGEKKKGRKVIEKTMDEVESASS